MAYVLTDVGEEWVLKTALAGASIIVGLYNDTADAFSDTKDLADLTTEPADGNYARQTDTADLAQVSGDWVLQNLNQISFDVTNTTGSVDSYFIVANLQAETTADGALTDHIVITGSLGATKDLSQLDTFNLDAQSAGISLD